MINLSDFAVSSLTVTTLTVTNIVIPGAEVVTSPQTTIVNSIPLFADANGGELTGSALTYSSGILSINHTVTSAYECTISGSMRAQFGYNASSGYLQITSSDAPFGHSFVADGNTIGRIQKDGTVRWGRPNMASFFSQNLFDTETVPVEYCALSFVASNCRINSTHSYRTSLQRTGGTIFTQAASLDTNNILEVRANLVSDSLTTAASTKFSITAQGYTQVNPGANSWNVSLNVGGSAVISDSMYIGRAAGSYGHIGYNAVPDSTANTWKYAIADEASWIQFINGGFNFYGRSSVSSPSAGSTINKLKLFSVNQYGYCTLGFGTDPYSSGQQTGYHTVWGNIWMGINNPFAGASQYRGIGSKLSAVQFFNSAPYGLTLDAGMYRSGAGNMALNGSYYPTTIGVFSRSSLNNGVFEIYSTPDPVTADTAITTFRQIFLVQGHGGVVAGVDGRRGLVLNVGDPTGTPYTNEAILMCNVRLASSNRTVQTRAGVGLYLNSPAGNTDVLQVYANQDGDLTTAAADKVFRLTALGQMVAGVSETTTFHELLANDPSSYVLNLYNYSSSSTCFLRFQTSAYNGYIGILQNNLISNKVYGAVIGSAYNVSVDTSGRFGTTSSLRERKGDINPLVNTDWVYDLPLYSFRYKIIDDEGNMTSELDNTVSYGTMADEAEKVNDNITIKEAITNKLTGVEYSRLIVPMLNELKKLRERVQELEGVAS